MGALGVVALIVIFVLIIAFAAVIIVLGGLPGAIAKKRGHPYAEVINVASWVGIFTGIFWPLVFICAFLPVPVRGASVDDENAAPSASAETQSQPVGDAS